jgi:glutaredoxin
VRIALLLAKETIVPDNNASLYRTPGCPFGERAKKLLEANGYSIDDHVLNNPSNIEEWKREHGVSSLPQVFIKGKHIGGTDELEQRLAQHATDVGLTTPNDLI